MNIRTSRGSKRLIAAAAAVAVAASTFAFSPSVSADANPDAERIAGANRYETAAAIALAAADFGFSCQVVLANGNSAPDGLSAAGLAWDDGAVILLTETNSIPAATDEAIAALTTQCGGFLDIKIVGGTSVVSQGVFDTLRLRNGIDTVRRFAGANRYLTSLDVAKRVDPSTIILVTGQDFPDALAAGPLAFYEGAAIVLHDGTSPSAEILAFLTNPNSRVAEVIIVGGTAAVPASIETALKGAGLSVSRLAGATRFETAVAVADYLKKADSDYAEGVILASGRNFPDALAASPLADRVVAPILLVESNSIPAATAKWHVDNADTISNVWAVGGTSVISAGVLSGAKAAASAVLPAATGVTVAIKNTARILEITNDVGSAMVTLSAVPGSAADGAGANPWGVSFESSAGATSITVAVDTSVPEFVVTIPSFSELNATNLTAAWNASPAAALLTAKVGTAGILDDPIVSEFKEGSTEMTFVVSFNRKIDSKDDTSFAVRSSALGSSVSLFNLSSATSADLSTDKLKLTAVVKITQASELFTPGIGVMKLLVGAVTANGYDNKEATLVITAAS